MDEQQSPLHGDVVAAAELAYARFCTGFLTGDWDPFFHLVADEVDFAWPVEPGAGRFTGREGRRLMEEHFRVFGGALRMTDIRRTATTVAGDTVIFEDDSRGDLAGQAYHARHCIFFTLRDGRVVGYREYIAQEPAGS
jgi:ketosteroid isomerase-like protein